MRACTQRGAAVAALAAVAWCTAGAAAQTRTQTQTQNTPITREEFERRLTELDAKHRADIAVRDQAIRELRAELARRPASDEDARARVRARENRHLLDDMLAEIDSTPEPPTLRTPANFNPSIAVVTDFLGTWSNARANDAYNRYDVREAELDFRAAVDPRADAVVVLAFARDVENPVFPEPDAPSGPESSVEVEEAYLLLHDFGISNLTAKLGRYHLRFGRQNLLHLHDLPTSDPSFVNQAFLAPEALSDAGLSLSYLVPNPWDQYFEVDFELISGEGAGAESPTLQGDLTADSPAFNTHLLWNTDLASGWNLELGGSWLHGHADPDNARDVDLVGTDLTLIRTDPSGGFNNLLLQGELIYGSVDQPDDTTSNAWGAYVLAQQQFNKDWYAGVRFDWTEDPGDAGAEAWGVSPYASWYWSEFLRFRLGYQHRDGDVPDADVVALQVTWIFGAHPPHPYWSMR